MLGAEARAAMHCTVRSLDEVLFDGMAASLSFETITGQVEVLPGHAEAFFVVVAGPMVIQAPEAAEPQRLEVSPAVCHVKDNRVTVVV